MNIPTICVPHGQNIYLNYDVNEYLEKSNAEKSNPPWAPPRYLSILGTPSEGKETISHKKYNLDISDYIWSRLI